MGDSVHRRSAKMPPFAGIFEQDQVQKIHEYIIERSHHWRDELLKRNAQEAGENKAE